MDDKQLEISLRDYFQHSVDAHAEVLGGLEDRVCETLDARAGAPQRTARPRRQTQLGMGFAFAGTALAALVIGMFIGGVWGVPFIDPSYRGVTFVVAMPEADTVAVIGDFNGWQPAPMSRDSNGIWSVAVDLEPGRYEYAFVVNGVTWKPDPRADEYVNSYGSTNSVKYVGAEGEAS